MDLTNLLHCVHGLYLYLFLYPLFLIPEQSDTMEDVFFRCPIISPRSSLVSPLFQSSILLTSPPPPISSVLNSLDVLPPHFSPSVHITLVSFFSPFFVLFSLPPPLSSHIYLSPRSFPCHVMSCRVVDEDQPVRNELITVPCLRPFLATFDWTDISGGVI
ncbi:hypothetical protein BCV69DRAFT_172687 [Microstroma glucosiphilum]|uniref:Uncharacterized protein n=1 Tax=Pseudomicrostroma glucosiphilum TaxID=1684307 RepID=A0A316UAM5_9BASI|nr:hypothetical protein BCV69DRAFT_172687 [Pseudomicrostroma glucosiphilum]PWN21521.1 hypothetical protein BCV69DRAFT_172687 [Pseudomicrostroma glucosiphilum]